MTNLASSQRHPTDWIFIVAGGAALIVLIAISLAVPPTATPDFAALVLLAALVVASGNLALDVSSGCITLTNLLAVSGLLIFGLAPALWLVFIGEAASDLIRTMLAKHLHAPHRSAWRTLVVAATNVALQILSLLAGWLILTALGGSVPLQDFSAAAVLRLLALFAGYFLVNNFMFSAAVRIEKGKSIRSTFWRDWQMTLVFDVLPLPLSIVIANIHFNLGIWSFAGIAALLLGGMLILHRLNQAQRAAERRVRELTSLSAISQAMRSSLDLPELLEAIHQQLNQLINADNFYIALYDPDANSISFPLVYENNAPVRRAGRPVANGMTEWIIQNKQALLIHENLPGVLRQMGLDLLGPPAESWLGVPILSEDKALGVLAIHHPTQRRLFDTSHQSLLITIAAQAAMAIRNAQFYSTMRQRTAEMAILNSVSTTLSASLDMQRVAQIMVDSILPIASCEKSAFFLLDDDGAHLRLAESRGLGATFAQGAQRCVVGPSERGVVAHTRSPMLVADIRAAPDLPTGLSAIAEAEGFRALAEMPLLAQGAIIGTLAAYYVQPRTFTQADLDLLSTFANQAAVAVANAKLYTRTDKALARRVGEMSAIEEIGRELLVTLDVKRIINKMIERAMQVTGANYSVVVLFDAALEEARLLAHQGYPPDIIAPLYDKPWPLHAGITGRVLRTAQTANTIDVHSDPDYYEAIPTVRSQLSVPIAGKGQVLGVITLESETPAAFDTHAVSFTEHLGNQAAIALGNARLYEKAQRRLRETSILYEASQQLTGVLDPDMLAARVVEQACKALDSTSCLLEFLDKPAHQLQVVASFTAPSARVAITATPYSAACQTKDYPATLRLLETREPLVVYANDPQADPAELRLLKESHQQAALIAPLVAGDTVIGIVEWLDDRPRRFNDEEIRLAQTITNQAAISIENSRLFQGIAEARDRLQAILNSASEGILMLDLSGRVVLINVMLELLWQISRQTLEGQLLQDLINRPALKIAGRLGAATSGIEAMLPIFKQLQQKMRATYQLPAPSTQVVERLTTPVLDSNERLMGWMVTLRDATEEHELQQMRDNLTSMIVHDLRGPLGAIASGFSMIRDIVSTAPDADFGLEVIQVSERSTQKLLTLVNSLLDINDPRRLQLNISAVNLHTLVKNVIDTLSPLAAENSILLSAQLPPLPLVAVDEEKISRVFMNLIDNALKFAQAGSSVTVLAEVLELEARTCVRCAVHDTGAGIPAEYLERIFDRFVQVPNQEGHRRGTGLGLAFCKLAIEAHGERIWAESAVGTGSTFYLTLPIYEDL